MKTPFLGAHNVSRSRDVSDQMCINLFPELVKGGSDAGALYECPGLDLKATVGIGPIRALHTVLTNPPTLYAVSREKVYSLTTSYTATLLGSINSIAGPVSIIDNGTVGNQVAIFDGTTGYVISSGTIAPMSGLPFTTPVTAAFQDGFGIVNQLNSNSWFQSNLNDLSTWQSLNFATSQAKPDAVVALTDIHREVWVLKQTNLEVWINAGTSGFTFQRIDGVFPEIGCAAAFSVAKAGESLIWLAQNDQGQGIVVMTEGYQAKRISTHQIEYAIAQYAEIMDAIGYVYQQEGHVFYVLTFPAGNATWVYDISTGLWHQRAALLNGIFNRHWSNCATLFNGTNLVGDYLTGNIYAFDMNTLTDNGTQKGWLRSWRAFKETPYKPLRMSALEINMMTGSGVAQADNPQVMLRWSDDGGHTWSNQKFAAAGKTGQTSQRVKFNRLGGTRRNSGLDRIFELSSADAMNVALMGADLV